MALVLELLTGWSDVGVPLLGLAATGELDVALVERRLNLKEQHGLLDIQHLGHNALTVARWTGPKWARGLRACSQRTWRGQSLLPARRPLHNPPGRHLAAPVS